MEYRKFGNSDLETSVIGLGGWPMGRGMYGSFDEREIIEAVHKALDLGITLFDTAQEYGWGASEEILGRALKGRRHNCIIVTKGGTDWDPEAPKKGTLSGYSIIDNSSKEFLNKMLEGSLKRLQTDYIDLFLIHHPDTSRPFSEPMGVFTKWKEEGKIRYGGVSNFSVAQMEESLKTFPIICNQVGYDLFRVTPTIMGRPEEGIFPFCREHGLGIMAYGSLSYGLLTGTMTADTKFEEADWRHNSPIFRGEHFVRNLRIVEGLKKIAASQGKAVAQLAVAWVLSNPTVTVALTGVRKPSEIVENAVAGDWKLVDEVKAEIGAVFEEQNLKASGG